MKRVIVAAVLLLALASAVVLAACGEEKVPAGSIAAIGDGTVTQAQFDQVLADAKAAYAAQKADFPAEGTAEYDTLKANIVTYLVQAQIIKQKAEELGVEVTTEEIDTRIASTIKQVGGQKKYDKLLEGYGMTEEVLRRQLATQMLQDEVRAKIGENITVSEADVKAYFENPDNESQFIVPETVTARHILVKTKAEAEKVQALLEADSSDANWKKVAKKYSTDPGSKNNGGNLGARPKGSFVKEFDDAAFKLKVGVISNPVKTQFGYHVIEVTKKAEGSTTSFEEAKSGIEQQLKLQREAEAWQKWLDEATAAAAVIYAVGFNPKELTATPSPAPAPESPAASPTPSPESST